MENKNEYDLLDLVRWGLDFLKKYLWCPFLFLVRFALKKWYFLVLAAFIGFGMSIWIPKFYRTIYSGQMIIKSRVCQSSDYVNLLQAISRETPSVIMSRMDVPVTAMRTYRGILPHYVYPMDTLKTGYMVDKSNQKINSDNSVLSNIFAVEVRSTDSSTIRLWGEAIEKYFKNHPYVQNANSMRIDELKKNMAILQNEIVMLDSLREIEYLENSRRSILINDKSGRNMLLREQTRLMHNDVLDLHNRVMGIQNALTYLSEPIEVISPMSLNVVPLTHWSKTYKKYMVLSVALMYGLLLAWHFRKEIIQFAKQ